MKMQTPKAWYKKYKIMVPAGAAALLLAVVAGWLLWPQTVAAWYSRGSEGSWQYRLKITVTAAEVDADLTNFPVYINLSHLPANFFENVQADGGDIRLTTAGGVKEIPREIASIDTAAQTGELHFKAPSLSNTENTEFYIYYGNASAANYSDTHLYGTHNVWSNNFAAVWHMNAGNVVDSTKNNNDGTNFGTAAASGLAGSARQFVNTESDHIEVPDSPSLRVPMPMTVTALYQFTSVSGSYPRLYDKGVNGSATVGYSHLYDVNGDNHQGRYGSGGSANTTEASVGTTTGAWESWAQVLEVGNQELFVDATSVGVSSFTDAISYDATALRIGGATNNASTQYFTGLIDELRISSAARSGGWISTGDSNLKSAATFYTLGSQEQKPPATTAKPGQVTIQSNSEGLVAHYSLGEGFEAKDRTPYGNHGTVQGATLTADRHQNSGGAYSFDGADDCISVPIGSSNPELDLTENLTLSAWIKPGGSTSSFQSIVRAGLGTDLRYSLVYNGSSGRIAYSWYDGSSFQSVSSTANVPQNQWSYVTAVKTASNTVSFYVNGEFNKSATITEAPNAPAQMSIGATICGTNQHFKGIIDDVRIYNRALGASEVESLHASYNPGLYVTDLQKGLVADYSLGDGFAAKDRTPYGNNGTVNGATLTTDRHGDADADAAYNFDGVDDYITLPNSTDFNMSNSFTISAWINPASIANETNYNIFYRYRFGEMKGYRLILAGYSGANNCLQLAVADGTQRGGDCSNYYLTDIGRWYHVAATYDQGTIKYYADGELVDTQNTAVTSIVNYDANAYIGRDGGSERLHGKLDEVRLWNRALNAAEIKTLYGHD